MTITVGIAAHSEPDRFQATLESVRRNTRAGIDILILADGPDRDTARAIRSVPGLPQSATREAKGLPACFNRLFRETSSSAVVLVESGSVVTRGWLDRLTAVFSLKPDYALAGPSTNLCWNQQGAFSDADGSQASLDTTAERAVSEFGESVRTLEPLYSLADFCYLVQRRVWDAIGPADESYGLGPCWEMDYNVRAARAGFAGVWAGAAYVYRYPFNARRSHWENALFERNKRLYQSKFCARQKSASKASYRDHCRGDDCPNFAPNTASTPLVRIAAPTNLPLVTCIMPTYNRRSFIARSLALFQAQDYPRLELLIVDDGVDAVGDLVPADPTIRYIRLSERRTIGAKRNTACEQAKGDVIVHWDDDDWYPPDRVTRQVNTLLESGADACGTSMLHYFDPAAQRAWLYTYDAQRPSWVAGNTLAYHRRFWEQNRFPDLQIGEDARFLWRNPLPRIHDMRSPGLCVGYVHQGNASPKRTHTTFWSPQPVEAIQKLMGELPAPASHAMVSCIMPTRNRRAFLPATLRYFTQQTYPATELLVIDDGDDNVSDLLTDVKGARYLRLARRMTIGAKRNFGCLHAAGSIIAHWDDDDWYAPRRLEAQVAALLEGTADITAFESTYVYQMAEDRCWTVSPELHRRMFVGDVHGGTLVYRRAAWESGIRYPSVDLAEDAAFLKLAMSRGYRLSKLKNPGLFVYVRHGDNAWRFQPGTFLESQGWTLIEPPAGFSIR